jgi:AcrR family transcriptional regulator
VNEYSFTFEEGCSEMEPANKRERNRALRREQILEAAVKVFARRGFGNATVAEIAEEAGVAPGTIYIYFEDKEDLFMSIPELISEPMLATFLEAAFGGNEPTGIEGEERLLTQSCAKAMETLLQNLDLVKSMLSSVVTLDDETRAEYFRQPLQALTILERYFRDRTARGIFREMNTAVVAQAYAVLVIMFVLIQELIRTKDVAPLAYEEISQELIKLLLYGIKKR